MFKVKKYDLAGEVEACGFYTEAFRKEKEGNESKWNCAIGSNEIKIERTREQKDEDNKERSFRRTKTKVRRVARRYQFKYFWTLTFRERYIAVVNPTNLKTTVYDVTDLEQAWKLWGLFVKRLREQFGEKFDYIVVPEIQEKRAEKYNEKIWHFHFLTNKYMPQNEQMKKKKNRSLSFDKRYNYSVNAAWTFGHTKATQPKKKSKFAWFYVVKYIAKNFEELGGKNKNRYRISQGLVIPESEIVFDSHETFIDYCSQQGKIKKSHYFHLGKEIEIFWIIYEEAFN